jgi:hypothetical protein
MDLSQFKKEEGIDDTPGGGMQFQVETGADEYTIELAYLSESSGGANALNLHLKSGSAFLRQTVYFTSGKAKGCSTTFEGKDGKKQYLPGYVIFSNLSDIVAGKDLSELDQETKVINLYSYDAGKEVPTEVTALPELMGEKAVFAVQKILENKRMQSGNEWVDTAETREKNELVRVYATDGRSLKEIRKEIPAEDAGDLKRWMKANNGVTKDKTTVKSTGASAPAASAAPAAAPGKSLFE